MTQIHVKNLRRTFKIYKKVAGILGSLKSFIHREYYDSHAVNDVSFDISKGELVGFIGPNGAGKTTTLKCLSGLLFPSSGEVSVLGFNPFDRKPEFLRQISLVMGQKNQLWWDLPAIESFHLNKEIYQVSDHDFKKRLDELVDLMGVADVVNVQVRKLSLGQRMKCELIAALIHRPKVLFLDEPTIGLDVVMQQRLREFIKEYNKKSDTTIILTSHYMKDVQELCERVIIIDHGKILYDGKLDDIVKERATHKIISIVLRKQVDKKKLSALGEIKLQDFPNLQLSVPFEKSNQIAARLLEDFPVEDLNIEEPDIEEIIREYFTKANP